MCWALYIASDKQLLQIPWDQDARAFHTQEFSELDLPVKAQFSFPNVIYLGSHLGCSCGFMAVDNEDQKEQAARTETVESLSRYLENVLRNGAHLEMFLCWEGDQTQHRIAEKLLFTQDFLDVRFPLEEREFARIILSTP
jgi:hypothetical protein